VARGESRRRQPGPRQPGPRRRSLPVGSACPAGAALPRPPSRAASPRLAGTGGFRRQIVPGRVRHRPCGRHAGDHQAM